MPFLILVLVWLVAGIYVTGILRPRGIEEKVRHILLWPIYLWKRR